MTRKQAQLDFAATPARLVGVDGAAGPVLERVLDLAAIMLAAEQVGGAQRALDQAVEYAKVRHQFGRPIGSFQAVQHHCADMAIDVLGSRLIGYEAIWRLSAGVDPPGEVAMTVSAAKAWVSDAYQRVCALGQQVHGAIGFTEEHDLHLFSTHAMSAALSFGDGDFHTERVASTLGLPGGDDRGGASVS
jgi:alkylation response protein AidB-like acyl-CoA dehydrogenase